jgi:hypothetical protein
MGMVGSAAGFKISMNTLSRLKGYKPLAFYSTRIFLLVRALSLAGLYK